ncbi:hypothetical protein [Tsukamurella pulmonis]|uniref:hypothetical protein n=1 Tax=Tsukamurella pulmonis TaxID=47312 RepID=UPI0011138767|nr:hypothetical protein [Tsukamurella pulmonis]
MASVKNILKHVEVVPAGKLRKCSRNPKLHLISKGEPCLQISDGPQRRSTYCARCAAEILSNADRFLADLHSKIDIPSPTPPADASV